MLTKRQIAEIASGLGQDTTGFPRVFQALGDAGRFNIFRLLMEYHDICVTDVAKVFKITVSAASQQLRVLERLGLVSRTRMGQRVCYKINLENPAAKRLIKLLRASNT